MTVAFIGRLNCKIKTEDSIIIIKREGLRYQFFADKVYPFERPFDCLPVADWPPYIILLKYFYPSADLILILLFCFSVSLFGFISSPLQSRF